MDILNILNSNLSDSDKISIIKLLYNKPIDYKALGGNVEVKGKTITPDTDITIEDSKFKVSIALTEEEKETGLSKIDYLRNGEGMLFVYDSPLKDLWFTMADTSIDLDIIFMDEEGEVTSVNPCKAFSKKPIPDREGNAMYVLEVNINSGIKLGDELDLSKNWYDELDDNKKRSLQNSKMLVLDENGDVLMRLEGGERIFSRIATRKILKLAIKAYKFENDKDFIKLGKIVFKELDALDSREPEYVSKPDKQ